MGSQPFDANGPSTLRRWPAAKVDRTASVQADHDDDKDEDLSPDSGVRCWPQDLRVIKPCLG